MPDAARGGGDGAGLAEWAADGCADPVQLYGLRNVVVDAGGEAEFAVALHGRGGEGDDLGLAFDGEPGADRAAGFESVHFGDLEIHDGEIAGAAFEGGEAFEAVGDGVGVVAEALEAPEADLLVDGVILGGTDGEGEPLADGPFGGAHAEDGGGRGGVEERADGRDERGGAAEGGEGIRGDDTGAPPGAKRVRRRGWMTG